MSERLIYCKSDVQKKVFYDIVKERQAQDDKFGTQDHDKLMWLAIIGEEFGEVSKEIIESQFDPKYKCNYREELVQLAASCIAALESLDRQKDK